jgi:hypothetical protein
MAPEVPHVRLSEVLAAAGRCVAKERAESSGVPLASQGQGGELRLVEAQAGVHIQLTSGDQPVGSHTCPEDHPAA